MIPEKRTREDIFKTETPERRDRKFMEKECCLREGRGGGDCGNADGDGDEDGGGGGVGDGGDDRRWVELPSYIGSLEAVSPLSDR